MSVALRFREHEEFQRTALHMALAGGAAGLLAWGIFRPAPGLGQVALVAAAVAAAGLSPAPWTRPLRAALRGALALLGVGCLALAAGPEGALGFALFFGGALSLGLRGRRLLVGLGASAGVGALALWTEAQVAGARELASLPGFAVAALSGLSFSMVAAAALVPRHLALQVDEVERAYREVAGSATGEVRELAERAHGVWTRARAELPEEEDENRRLLAEAVVRLLQSARRWSAIEAVGSQDQATALAERMESLDARIEAARDDVVRRQYQSARAALSEQLRALEDIATHRERVIARMHNYLAVMERLRLAVVKVESADASREALDPIVSDLEELGEDIESSTAALDAAERAAAER